MLEDVHWAEPTFLDLVEYVAGWSEGAPIVLLSVTRPELFDARPDWGERGDRPAAAAARGGGRATTASYPRLRTSTARRSPACSTRPRATLFLEQLAAVAAEQGLQPGRVPSSLDALLASRLDRLPADEREVLERAAIVGREFTRGAVEALWRATTRRRCRAL